MKKFRDFAMLAVIAGLAGYQGRQLHIYAASSRRRSPRQRKTRDLVTVAMRRLPKLPNWLRPAVPSSSKIAPSATAAMPAAEKLAPTSPDRSW